MAANVGTARKQAARAEIARRELERRSQVTATPDPVASGLPPGMTGSLASDGVQPLPLSDFPKAIGGVGEVGLQLLTGALATPLSGLAGIGASIPGGASPAERVEQVQSALTYQPRLGEGQGISGALAEPFEAIDNTVTDSLDTGSPATSAFLKTLALGGPSILAKRPVNQAVSKVKKAPSTVPTTENLFRDGSKAFTRAHQSGARIAPQSGGRLAAQFERLTDENGITVRMNKTLHPDSFAVMKELKSKAKGEMSFDDLVELRELANDAAGAVAPRDAFRGRMIRDKIDEFVDGLADSDIAGGDRTVAVNSLKEARNLWSRARKSEVIDRLMEKAGTDAQNFSGSGYENALRIRFKQLANNDKKIKMFTQSEQAAIQQVARGGPVDNILRMIGKANPKGVISGGLLPIALTTINPALAAGVAAGGFLGRKAATARTIGNAKKASELVRRGGLLDKQ